MGEIIPDRWLQYLPVGRQIRGTRFIAFKVPLKGDHGFKPRDVMEFFPRLRLVIDLTNTDRYYDRQDFLRNNIEHVKIWTAGKRIPPEHQVERFIEAVDNFLHRNAHNGKLIGVHCTHGVNRTGYMICRYMIQILGIPPDQAILDFDSARGHRQERPHYLTSLRRTVCATEGARFSTTWSSYQPSPLRRTVQSPRGRSGYEFHSSVWSSPCPSVGRQSPSESLLDMKYVTPDSEEKRNPFNYQMSRSESRTDNYISTLPSLSILASSGTEYCSPRLPVADKTPHLFSTGHSPAVLSPYSIAKPNQCEKATGVHISSSPSFLSLSSKFTSSSIQALFGDSSSQSRDLVNSFSKETVESNGDSCRYRNHLNISLDNERTPLKSSACYREDSKRVLYNHMLAPQYDPHFYNEDRDNVQQNFVGPSMSRRTEEPRTYRGLRTHVSGRSKYRESPVSPMSSRTTPNLVSVPGPSRHIWSPGVRENIFSPDTPYRPTSRYRPY